MLFDDTLYDGEAKARTDLRRGRMRFFHLVESVKDERNVFLRNARTMVPHDHKYFTANGIRRNKDG